MERYDFLTCSAFAGRGLLADRCQFTFARFLRQPPRNVLRIFHVYVFVKENILGMFESFSTDEYGSMEKIG
jgi:hypothetical protein